MLLGALNFAMELSDARFRLSVKREPITFRPGGKESTVIQVPSLIKELTSELMALIHSCFSEAIPSACLVVNVSGSTVRSATDGGLSESGDGKFELSNATSDRFIMDCESIMMYDASELWARPRKIPSIDLLSSFFGWGSVCTIARQPKEWMLDNEGVSPRSISRGLVLSGFDLVGNRLCI